MEAYSPDENNLNGSDNFFAMRGIWRMLLNR